MSPEITIKEVLDESLYGGSSFSRELHTPL